jgi:protein gp37
MAIRLRGRYGYPLDDPFKVTFHPDKLDEPLHWKNPRRIFLCSMGDLFHENVHRDWILRIYLVIRKCPQHQFFILTKRPERMNILFSEWIKPSEALADMSLKIKDGPQNLWLGVTVCDQAEADQ